MFQFSLRKLFLLTSYCAVVALSARLGWEWSVVVAGLLFTTGRRTLRLFGIHQPPPKSYLDAALIFACAVPVAVLTEFGLLLLCSFLTMFVFEALLAPVFAFLFELGVYAPAPLRYVIVTVFGYSPLLFWIAVYLGLHQQTLAPQARWFYGWTNLNEHPPRTGAGR